MHTCAPAIPQRLRARCQLEEQLQMLQSCEQSLFGESGEVSPYSQNCALTYLAASLVPINALVKLIRTVLSKPSVLVSSSEELLPATPALFTKIDKGPKVSSAYFIAVATSVSILQQ